MILFQRLFNKIRRFYYRLTLSTEDWFYYNLFVVNGVWSSKDPNEDEQNRWNAMSVFIRQIDQNNRTLSILEVGSGRGWLTSILSRYGTVQGIEPVGIVVEHARKLFPDINFFAGTMGDFRKKLPNRRFDLIVCSEVIEHVPDSAKSSFVCELSLLLNSGGHVILTTPRKEVMSLLPYDPHQPVEDWLTEKEAQLLFHTNGFNTAGRSTIIAPLGNQEQELYQVWLFKKGT